MRLSFDTIDEVKEFVKSLKNPRNKGDADDGASGTSNPGTGGSPAPLQPPTGQAGFPGASGFAPPVGGAAIGGAFPAAGAGLPPEVLALVNRITAKIDGAIASGQPADQVLQWFRGQCGPEAAAFTMDQIKQHALPKLTMPALDQIAKLMNA